MLVNEELDGVASERMDGSCPNLIHPPQGYHEGGLFLRRHTNAYRFELPEISNSFDIVVLPELRIDMPTGQPTGTRAEDTAQPISTIQRARFKCC